MAGRKRTRGSGTEKTCYAIVGAGTAGVIAAETIRGHDPRGRIVLINGEPAPPYCRPLVIELLTGERAAEQISLRPASWAGDNRIDLIRDAAVRLDPQRRTVALSSGAVLEYEKLLLATGSVPAIPSIPGLADVDVHHLCREQDSAGLAAACRPGSRGLVVGLGLIGLQAVTALTRLRVKVTVVEMMDKVLPLLLDREAAALVQRRMEDNGVQVRTLTALARVGKAAAGSVAAAAGAPFVAVTAPGEEIPFDFLVLAAGMRPDLSLLEGTAIEKGRGVRVSAAMETSVPGIWAAGDVTEYDDWMEGGPVVHAHWVNAWRQGRIAGASMAGAQTEAYEPMFLNSLSVFGLPVITIGTSRIDAPQGATVYSRIVPERPAARRLVFRDGRLVAVTLVNDVEQAGVLHHLMRERVDLSAIARSIFEEDGDAALFLDRLHAAAVRGEIAWPESMDRVDGFRKDMSRTRWGAPQGEGK